MPQTRNPVRYGPLVAAGVLLGAGLGGFVDGIVLHQIVQVHNLLSARIPVTDLLSAKVNMFWDGVFHAGVWVLTAVGLGVLWRAGAQPDVPWSGRTFVGALLGGWGLFNVVEGLIDHQILGLHHVHEYAEDPLVWDLAFLAFGAALMGIGWALVRSGRRDAAPRDRMRPA